MPRHKTAKQNQASRRKTKNTYGSGLFGQAKNINEGPEKEIGVGIDWAANKKNIYKENRLRQQSCNEVVANKAMKYPTAYLIKQKTNRERYKIH